MEHLGYSEDLENYRIEKGFGSMGVARVVSEHRERYRVFNGDKEMEAELLGNLRFTATTRAELPAVGDWVAVTEFDENRVLIHHVFPRKSILERTAVGKKGEKQIVAVNVDYGLITQAMDRDLNLNRAERYLAICYNAGVQPILLLTKSDLLPEARLSEVIESVRLRVKKVPVVAISNLTGKGYDQLSGHLLAGRTYCLLGSSGVGKSTLINNLTGSDQMKTGSISASTAKGKHVTTHRELIVVKNGAILIDNPGMREVGISDAGEGLEDVFDLIYSLDDGCRYKDCTHVHEEGCSVIEAVQSGDLEQDVYENYLKLVREKSHFESTVAERKQKDKELGKVIKDYKKTIKRDSSG